MKSWNKSVKAQKFESYKAPPARRVIRPIFGIIGLLSLASAVTGQRGYSMGATATGVSLALVIIGWCLIYKPSRDQRCHYWLSTAFSGGAVGALTGPASVLAPSLAATVLCSVAATLALMASLTGFCAGRLMYVLLFRIDERTDTACD